MSNNGSINDALDKAQRGLLDFFFPPQVPLLRARGGPGAAVRGVQGVAAPVR